MLYAVSTNERKPLDFKGSQHPSSSSSCEISSSATWTKLETSSTRVSPTNRLGDEEDLPVVVFVLLRLHGVLTGKQSIGEGARQAGRRRVASAAIRAVGRQAEARVSRLHSRWFLARRWAFVRRLGRRGFASCGGGSVLNWGRRWRSRGRSRSRSDCLDLLYICRRNPCRAGTVLR
jgi:hypothetical protein